MLCRQRREENREKGGLSIQREGRKRKEKEKEGKKREWEWCKHRSRGGD